MRGNFTGRQKDKQGPFYLLLVTLQLISEKNEDKTCRKE
jgi:hypothetical protein